MLQVLITCLRCLFLSLGMSLYSIERDSSLPIWGTCASPGRPGAFQSQWRDSSRWWFVSGVLIPSVSPSQSHNRDSLKGQLRIIGSSVSEQTSGHVEPELPGLALPPWLHTLCPWALGSFLSSKQEFWLFPGVSCAPYWSALLVKTFNDPSGWPDLPPPACSALFECCGHLCLLDCLTPGCVCSLAPAPRTGTAKYMLLI